MEGQISLSPWVRKAAAGASIRGRMDAYAWEDTGMRGIEPDAREIWPDNEEVKLDETDIRPDEQKSEPDRENVRPDRENIRLDKENIGPEKENIRHDKEVSFPNISSVWGVLKVQTSRKS